MARRTRVRIDMTPMVDVAFLLLIFFMSTTQFRPPEIVSVELPASRSEIHVPETDVIVLTVNREGRVFISTEQVVNTQELETDRLVEGIMAWRSRNPDAVVVVKGDKNAGFGAVSDVMDALAESKTNRFNLMTDLSRRSPADESEG